MSEFYTLLKAQVDVVEEEVITILLGEGTPFEAVARVFNYEDYWGGFVVFQSERYSPLDPDIPMAFKHVTPGAAGGSLALTRAQNHWETLCALFKGLEGSK